jgi:hypothetical protein
VSRKLYTRAGKTIAVLVWLRIQRRKDTRKKQNVSLEANKGERGAPPQCECGDVLLKQLANTCGNNLSLVVDRPTLDFRVPSPLHGRSAFKADLLVHF